MADEKKCDINGKTVLSTTKKSLTGDRPEIINKDKYYSLNVRPLGKCCGEAKALSFDLEICEAEAKKIAEQKVVEEENMYQVSLNPSDGEHREHQRNLIMTDKELEKFLNPIEKRMK